VAEVRRDKEERKVREIGQKKRREGKGKESNRISLMDRITV
jgi:hypothetical protein